MQLNSLLNTIASKVDHARVVQQVKKSDNLPLILPYLKQVQQHNVSAVNDAVNEIYVEAEQYEKLRVSIRAGNEHCSNCSVFGTSERLFGCCTWYQVSGTWYRVPDTW